MKRTINVGCGDRCYKYYPTDEYKCINVDIRGDLPGVDIVCDVTKLPYTDNYFDYMLASDILEHFPLSKTLDVLREWRRVIKPGGNIEFRVPNLAVICAQYNGSNAQHISWLLYGAQDYEYNFHYIGFDRKWLTDLCYSANLSAVEYREEGNNFILLVKKV